MSIYDMINEAYLHSSFKNIGLLLFLVLIFILITIVGYLGSTLFINPLLILLEKVILKIPIISLVYSSLKDILSAFVGEDKKFDKPALIKLGDGVYKIGFITNDDLSKIGFEKLVSVYLPHSYNFSGNHFLTEKENIKEINLPSAELMKLIVSGGVAGYEDIIKKMES